MGQTTPAVPTEFTIEKARDQGYVVFDQDGTDLVCAGTLDDCLAYMRGQFMRHEPQRSVSDNSGIVGRAVNRPQGSIGQAGNLNAREVPIYTRKELGEWAREGEVNQPAQPQTSRFAGNCISRSTDDNVTWGDDPHAPENTHR